MELMQELALREELKKQGYDDATAMEYIRWLRKKTGFVTRVPYPWEKQ